MKWKTRIEIELPKNSDPFKQITKLLSQGKVLRSFVQSAKALVVIYDNRQLTIDEILKVTGGKCINEDLQELLKTEEELMRNRAKKHRSNNETLGVGL